MNLALVERQLKALGRRERVHLMADRIVVRELDLVPTPTTSTRGTKARLR